MMFLLLFCKIFDFSSVFSESYPDFWVQKPEAAALHAAAASAISFLFIFVYFCLFLSVSVY